MTVARAYKYTSGFYDRKGHKWELKIKQKDYSGAATVVSNMGSTPVEIDYGVSTRWMFQPVYASNLNWNFVASTRLQFSDLVDVDAIKNRVELYKDDSIYWMGFSISELYSEPIKLKEAPAINFVAADFKLLEKYNMDELKDDANGYVTTFKVVRYCLNKLEFDFGFRVASALETDFFGDQFVALSTRLSIFSELNCYEVLQKIFIPYGTCYQCNGRWHIISNRKKIATFDYTDYTSEGVLESTSTYGGLVTTDRFSETNFFGLIDGDIIKVPPIKEFTIIQELGVVENIVKNGGFDEGYTEFQSWFHWMWVANTDVEVMQKDDTNFIVVKRGKFPGIIPKDIRQELLDGFLFSETTSQLLRVSVKYALLGEEGSSALIYITMKNSANQYLKYTPSTEVYYWGAAGAIDNILISTDGTTVVPTTSKVFNELSFSTFEMDIPLTDGAITIMLNDEISPTGNTTGACFTDVSAHIINSDLTELDQTLEVTPEINSNNNYIPDDVELFFGNPPPDVQFNELIAYDNIILPQWTLKYSTYYGTLIELVEQQIRDAYTNAPIMLQGLSFYSDIFTIDSVWTDPSMPTTRWMPLRVVFDVRMMTWEGDLIQIITDEEITPDFLDADFADSDFFD